MAHKKKINQKGRYCAGCRTFKPWSAFYLSVAGTNGHTSRCRECIRPGARKPCKDNKIDSRGRECITCHRYRSWAHFYKSNGPYGHQSECNACRTYRVWKSNLARDYGITPEQVRQLHEGQGHACAVCGGEYALKGKDGKNGSAFVFRRAGDVLLAVCGRCCYSWKHFAGVTKGKAYSRLTRLGARHSGVVVLLDQLFREGEIRREEAQDRARRQFR